MSEVDALDFHSRLTDTDNKTSKYRLVHEPSNAEITVTMESVDRKKILDEINKLPSEMLQTLSEAEDEDEAQELAEERNMLSSVNGDTVEAFENICSHSLTHDELTSHHIDDIVGQLSFEVLFEMGSEIIEMSLGDSGSIKDFHEVGSDKSS